MKLHELKFTPGSKQSPKRLGRGSSSGLGKTSGKGHKGQKARSGGSIRPGFEGGQTPLFRRLPKRGFNNYEFRTNYAVINLDELNRFENDAIITPELLIELNIIKKPMDGIKVLGRGTLDKKLVVRASKFSETAKAAIEAKGGKAEVI